MYEKDLAQRAKQIEKRYRNATATADIRTVTHSVTYIKGRNISDTCNGRKLNKG
jgi:hypothetical protein